NIPTRKTSSAAPMPPPTASAPRCGRPTPSVRMRWRPASRPARSGSTNTSIWPRISPLAVPSSRASARNSQKKALPNSRNCRSSRDEQRRPDCQPGIAAPPPRSRLFAKAERTMFDAQCDLAALVYGPDQDPDAVLRGFAADLGARGLRAVGMVQAGQCADSSLSAVLLPSGERLLLAQDFDPAAKGCRLDLARLQSAGERIAEAMAQGADLLIVNRFGKRERDGKGL